MHVDLRFALSHTHTHDFLFLQLAWLFAPLHSVWTLHVLVIVFYPLFSRYHVTIS